MGKVAFLFSGQGAQHPGMGAQLAQREPAAKAVFDTFQKDMPDLERLCFEGTKEELTQTQNAHLRSLRWIWLPRAPSWRAG